VTQAELDAGGNLVNTVTADSNESDPAQDTHSIPISQGPALAVDKDSTTITIGDVGPVTYTFVVTNTGNQTLTGITVLDPNCDVDPVFVDGDLNNDDKLQRDEIWTYTCDHTVTQAELDAGGNLVNTVTADSNESDPAQDTHSIPISQGPALSLTKSASPTVYSAAGQVITYTYGLTNSGNVTLTGPFVVTDDKIGTIICGTPLSTLAPGASFVGSCSATYTIQPGDVKPTNDGSVTNTATASAKDPNGQTVTSNQAQATVRQIAATGKIAPTATTCQDFTDGTAGDLTQILYGLKGQKINNVAPGVLFYYSLVTVSGAGPHTISVVQTTNPDFTPFRIQQSQANLYNANCVKLASNRTGTFTVTAGTYVVGIKYDPSTVIGKIPPAGNGEVVYTFTTFVDNSAVASSPDSLTLRRKP
jgi:uncharacterized repeat protein (TIGR01451 family)